MMKAGKLFLCGTMLVVVVGLVLGIHGAVCAQDAKLIKIHGVGEEKMTGIFIDPETAYIKKNTIVVWLSGVEQQEIKIEFADGKKCKSVTAHPMNFEIDTARWCYVTSYVPFAATSSLQFVDVGTYKYKVISKDGKINASGVLVVD